MKFIFNLLCLSGDNFYHIRTLDSETKKKILIYVKKKKKKERKKLMKDAWMFLRII